MPDKFQERALRTWHSSDFPAELQRDHATLGLAGEIGEFAELHKKDLFKPGHKSTRIERLQELGDVLYYLLILIHLEDAEVEDISLLNSIKLRSGHDWQPDYYSRDGQMGEVAK